MTAAVAVEAATDAAGNGNTASTSTDTMVTFDITPPTVTVEQAISQPDPTNALPISYTAVFSEPVTGFSDVDATLGGTALPTAATVTETAPNDGTTYSIAVSGMTQSGTVTVTVAAGAATDTTGNGNVASARGSPVKMFQLPSRAFQGLPGQ